MELTKCQRKFLYVLLRSTYESTNYVRDCKYSLNELYQEMENKGVKTHLDSMKGYTSEGIGLDGVAILNKTVDSVFKDVYGYIIESGLVALKQIVDEKKKQMEDEMHRLVKKRDKALHDGKDVSIFNANIASYTIFLEEVRSLVPEDDLHWTPGIFSLQNKHLYFKYLQKYIKEYIKEFAAA